MMPIRVILIILSYALAALTVLYVGWLRLGRRPPWWLRALAPFALWVLAPVLILPLLGLWLREALFWGASLLAWGLYVAHFVWPLRPRRRREAPPDAPRLRVMTANLDKHNNRWQEMAATIAWEKPDIVALQELKPGQAKAIAEALAEQYPHRLLYPGIDAEGMGLLSRHPIVASELHQGPLGATPILEAYVRVDGRKVRVINAHPRIPILRTVRLVGLPLPAGLDTREREADVKEITQLVDGHPEDSILLGDMNTTEQCPEYRWLAAQWRDAYREAAWGPGATFPVKAPFFGWRPPLPLFRIDYIFTRGDWLPLEARTGYMPGSDHRYLVVDLVWPCK